MDIKKNNIKIKSNIIFVLLIMTTLIMILTSKSYAEDTNLLNKTYIIKYINNYRRLYSLSPLTEERALNKAAENHATYIKQNGTKGTIEDSSKKGFTGVYPWDRAASLGFSSSLISEEIVKNNQSIDNTVSGMMASPIIRANVLNPTNEKIGVGTVGDIYVIEFAQGKNLYEAEILYPQSGTSIPANYAYSNGRESSYKLSMMYFSKEEISDATFLYATVREKNSSKTMPIEANVSVLSNTRAILEIKTKDKLVSNKEYEVVAAFRIEFLSGNTKNVSRTWRFSTNGKMNFSDKNEDNRIEIEYLKGNWAYESIREFVNKKYIDVDINGGYNPNEIIKRAEIANIMDRSLGLSNVQENINFKDVTKDNKYYESIMKVNAYGIMQGVGNSNFGINKGLTREELIVIMMNVYEKLKGNVDIDNSKTKLKDLKTCSTWAQEKVKKTLSLGLLSGREDEMIHPKDELTKAECIALLSRLKKAIE